jgi:hypothetical protein
MVECMSDSLQPVQVGASYVVDRYDACISFFIHTPCSTCYFLPRIACIVVLANADADGVPASFVSPPPAACVYKTSLPMQNHSGCRRYKQSMIHGHGHDMLGWWCRGRATFNSGARPPAEKLKKELYDHNAECKLHCFRLPHHTHTLTN